MSIDSNSPIELLTVAEVADKLRISISGVRRLQHARKLPFVKVGGSIRFFKSDVVAFLRKRRLEAIEHDGISDKPLPKKRTNLGEAIESPRTRRAP